MNSHDILTAVDLALKRVSESRFYESERGYQGACYSALTGALKDLKLLPYRMIVEMEYQKSAAKHGLTQRPDIIVHLPTEHGSPSVNKNNLLVIAMKHRASSNAAMADFEKLDDIMRRLDYEFGVFINVDSILHHADSYHGRYPKRMHCYAVKLEKEEFKCCTNLQKISVINLST
jgi:hypothetical protein